MNETEIAAAKGFLRLDKVWALPSILRDSVRSAYPCETLFCKVAPMRRFILFGRWACTMKAVQRCQRRRSGIVLTRFRMGQAVIRRRIAPASASIPPSRAIIGKSLAVFGSSFFFSVTGAAGRLGAGAGCA